MRHISQFEVIIKFAFHLAVKGNIKQEEATLDRNIPT